MLKIKLVVVGFAVMSLMGCSEQAEEKKGSGTQVAAIVNGEEVTVHQINDALRKNKVRAGADVDQKTIANQVLDKLIDQSVVYQAAVSQGLDRDPDVVSAIEFAKVQILNKAYLTKRLQKNISISESEIEQYFEQNPYVFAQRKVFEYTLLRIRANDEEKEVFAKQLGSLDNVESFKKLLDEAGSEYKQTRELVSSEKVAKPLLESLYTLKADDIGLLKLTDGLIVIQLNASLDKSMTLAEAKPMIERFLQNKKQQETLKGVVKHLKTSAEVKYMGAYSSPEISETPETPEVPVIN